MTQIRLRPSARRSSNYLRPLHSVSTANLYGFRSQVDHFGNARVPHRSTVVTAEHCRNSQALPVQVSTFLSELEAAAGVAAEGGPDSGPAVARLLRAVAGVRDQVHRFSTERSGLQARAVPPRSESTLSAHGLASCSAGLRSDSTPLWFMVSGFMAEMWHKVLPIHERNSACAKEPPLRCYAALPLPE